MVSKTNPCRLCGKRILKKFVVCPTGCLPIIRDFSFKINDYGNKVDRIVKKANKDINKIVRFK